LYKGEIYTQGHGIPPYISEWTCPLATTSFATRRNIHPGTWHSSMYISEWDHTVPPMRLLPAACATREINTPRTLPLHVYIRMGSTRGAATSYYQQQPQGRNIHPGTWHSSMVRMGSTRCRH
jgi:hypothetical protein